VDTPKGRTISPDYSRHSPFTEPGPYSASPDDVEPDVPSVSAIARNVIVHYRHSRVTLPETSSEDIHARWLSRILEIDQSRHPAPLHVDRPEADRVQGCCRDHTLLAVAVFRQHGIAARSRVGFADYLRHDRRSDHVVAEAWLGGRWVRFDPAISGPRKGLATPHDTPDRLSSPFLTAAAAWIGHRRDGRSVDDLGVQVGPVSFKGPPFVFTYLIMEMAHRLGDELLLWDSWGGMPGQGGAVDTELADRLARLLLAADSGDREAEQQQLTWYRQDARLHPGSRVIRHSPRGSASVVAELSH
jgi:transglutaminase-like putative cysteine protease